MLRDGQLDAIAIASPDDLHHEMTMAAIEAGLHVLCEKPLAMTGDQAKEMYDRAQAANVKHMTLFTWRWMPHFRYLKQLVDDGYIGRCSHASFRFIGGYGWTGAYRWRFDGRRSNGIVSDLGAHLFDLARWYVGDIASVNANLINVVDRPGPDGASPVPTNDLALVTLAHKKGAQSALQASALSHRGDQFMNLDVHLHGELGTLEVNQIFGGLQAGVTFRGVRHDEETFGHLTVPDAYRNGLDENNILAPFVKQPVGPRLFIDSILADQPVSPSFYDGWQVQEAIDAALQSHERGSRVSLP